jgi:hypothetical protein
MTMLLAAMVVTVFLVVVIVVTAHRSRNERGKHTTGGVINSVAATGARVRAELERETRGYGRHALTTGGAPILLSGCGQQNPSLYRFHEQGARSTNTATSEGTAQFHDTRRGRIDARLAAKRTLNSSLDMYRGSPVVGYVRSAKFKDPKLDELEARIRNYAEERGYNLITVRREEGISGVAAHKPMLEQIIREVAVRKYVGVIVPSEEHLSSKPSIAHHVNSRIEHAGGWVEVSH